MKQVFLYIVLMMSSVSIFSLEDSGQEKCHVFSSDAMMKLARYEAFTLQELVEPYDVIKELMLADIAVKKDIVEDGIYPSIAKSRNSEAYIEHLRSYMTNNKSIEIASCVSLILQKGDYLQKFYISFNGHEYKSGLVIQREGKTIALFVLESLSV